VDELGALLSSGVGRKDGRDVVTAIVSALVEPELGRVVVVGRSVTLLVGVTVGSIVGGKVVGSIDS